MFKEEETQYCPMCEELAKKLDQLKAEVKSKTEYIQEQRDIINQYSKEIEMYKKCQGKRASKREEELKAEVAELKKQLTILDDEDVVVEITVKQFEEYKKLKQTLTEIKSILELYANSKIGEEQSDGTYKLSSGICAIQDSFGFCTTTYDPRPARQALQKISEVEDEYRI